MAPIPERFRRPAKRRGTIVFGAERIAAALKVGREVDGIAVSGIAMTGKRVPHQDRTREVIGVWSPLVPRNKIETSIAIYES